MNRCPCCHIQAPPESELRYRYTVYQTGGSQWPIYDGKDKETAFRAYRLLKALSEIAPSHYQPWIKAVVMNPSGGATDE